MPVPVRGLLYKVLIFARESRQYRKWSGETVAGAL